MGVTQGCDHGIDDELYMSESSASNMTVISLTSIPSRFGGLHKTLGTLLQQGPGVEEIRIYIPKSYRRFPDWNGETPSVPPQVNIIRVDDDFGPASKVLHVADDLKGEDTPIIFCDDDRLYPVGWAQKLLRAHKERPDHCIATHGRHLYDIVSEPPLELRHKRAKVGKEFFDPKYRFLRTVQRLRELKFSPTGQRPSRGLVAQAGQTEILLGYAGVLVTSDFFDEAFYDIPDDLWMVDDIWLSGHMARQKIPVWLPKRVPVCLRSENDPVDALRNSVFNGEDRMSSNRFGIQYFQDKYGVWKE
ncbi:MAG: glycosyltransferase family A protein [Pelagimonas sp.]|uniref:glycosyltransferase family A protein n=1 Tax=Pelagimonas sp. TaxID=2073170 RepID=UPI003D6C1D91